MPRQATPTADLAARHRTRTSPLAPTVADSAPVTARRRWMAHSMPLAEWDRRLFDAGQTVPLVGPCLLVLLATLLFRVTDADLLIAGLFHGGVLDESFPLARHPLLVGIYDWGPVPAWLLGIGGLGILAAWAVRLAPTSKARGAVFLLAFLILGPVLLVNVAYKGYWGRPRPDQTTHFGGSQPFLHVLEKGPAGEYCSFPTGHAAAGFCLIAPAFLLYRRRPRLAGGCMAFGLLFGLIVGWGRVAQGRHFASDVVWAAAVVYFAGCALDYLLLAKAPTQPRRKAAPSATGDEPMSGEKGRQGHQQAAQPAKPRRKAA